MLANLVTKLLRQTISMLKKSTSPLQAPSCHGNHQITVQEFTLEISANDFIKTPPIVVAGAVSRWSSRFRVSSLP